MQPSELKRNSHRAGESTRAQGRGKAQQRGRSTRRPRKEGRGKAKEKEAEGKGKTQDKGRGLHSLNAPCGRGEGGGNEGAREKSLPQTSREKMGGEREIAATGGPGARRERESERERERGIKTN